MLDILIGTGKYFLMLKRVFSKFTQWRVLKPLIIKEMDTLILGSLGIVLLITFFIGTVATIQTALNLNHPLIPKKLIGFATKQSIILEFAPTFIPIILCGKIGSYITSSIGTMRVTEQIDALEVMGVNSINYLIFPKIIALMLLPFVICLCIFAGILGGYLMCLIYDYATIEIYMEGIYSNFDIFQIYYALLKSACFSILLATVPAFHGYYLKGGALDVGKANTKSFIWTATLIILLNFIITKLMLG